MPADFLACVAQRGRVRTKKLPKGRFIRICFLGGKSYPGEVRKAKKEDKR